MKLISLIVCVSLAGFLQTDTVPDDVPPPPRFTAQGHSLDSLDVVKNLVQKKQAVLIDVREQREWDAGHLKAAKLVPLSAVKADQLTADMQKYLPMDKPIYCHCASGGRVLIVAELLQAKGYDVRPLRPGYEKLLAEGFQKAMVPADGKENPDAEDE
ncbi:MAG: rhodanese-like domain-containing protein [Fuerstiella sp.]